MSQRGKPLNTLEFTYCILVYLTISKIIVASSERSSYGEFCNASQKCDKSSWLSCQKGSCLCIKPDVMLFDPNIGTGKCVAKSGERCKYMVEGIEKTPVFELIDCVENATCRPEGFCTCDSRFYENPVNGTCIKGQSLNQTCDSLRQCSKYEGLICGNTDNAGREGKCQCNEKESPLLYFPKENVSRCVGFPGHSCVNSTCRNHSTCVKSKSTSTSKCVCDPGYWLDYQEKKCVRQGEMFDNCTRNDQCMFVQGSQLVCVDGKCSCNPKLSRYETPEKSHMGGHSIMLGSSSMEQSNMKCVGLAGTSCIQGYCIPRAFCQRTMQNGYHGGLGLGTGLAGNGLNSGLGGGGLGLGGNYNYAQTTTTKKPEIPQDKCYCNGEYKQSKSGNCVVGFLRPCASGHDCMDELVCKQNLCQCPYPDQIYNPLSNSCESKIDGPCNSTSPCIHNAECSLFSTSPFEAGHCQCKSGFVKNMEGTCDVAFDQPCIPTVNCDQSAGLVCTNQRCSCNEFSQYNTVSRTCLKRIGASCNLEMAVDNYQECVEYSCCAQNHLNHGANGTCKCLPGFVETPVYTCKLDNEIILNSK